MTMDSGYYADSISAINELFRRSRQYNGSAEFIKFFDFIARFKHYSNYNKMLVYVQNPAVTFFGGQTYWRQEFSRGIGIDAKPHIILAPNGPIMLVYDVFDTIGYLTPEEFLASGLGTSHSQVTGWMSGHIVSRTLKKVVAWGIEVTYKPLSYFTGGYFRRVSNGRLEICLKQNMSVEENFSVLIHELAHLFLGHVGQVTLINPKRIKPIVIAHRAVSPDTQELEAETISFLICKKIGLETRSAEYLAAFIPAEEGLSQFSYEHVIRTADKIESTFY